MCRAPKTDILETKDKRFQGWETRNRMPTLIIAKPGWVGDCLCAVLRAIISLEAVGQPDDGRSPMAMLPYINLP
jgi:hypothetical protein